MKSEFENKKILVLGANPETANIVKVAQSLGVYTIVTDYLPAEKSPAKQIADEILDISTADTGIRRKGGRSGNRRA